MENERETAEDVAVAGSEADELRRENESLAAEVQKRDTRILQLEEALSGTTGEVSGLKQELEKTRQAADELGRAYPAAVDAYRDLVVSYNPGIPAELVTGNSIDEVNDSLKSSLALMERVRQEMDAEASKTRVPAGAPQRVPLDLSGMTPREKIRYAIGGTG